MKESMALLIKAVDGFGFLSEDFGFDLVLYEFSRDRTGYFRMIFENRDLRLSLTLEKGQMYIHAASMLYPDEWHSMLRLVRHIARKGGNLTHDEQDTDYWRKGMKLESQFSIAGAQLEKTLRTITELLSGNNLEFTRAEMKGFGRPQAEGKPAAYE
jgi:hypothetical protein